jgi:predicted NAD/FAD-binding protein
LRSGLRINNEDRHTIPMSSRTYNTPHREDWNAPIHNILKAIDNHTQEYFKGGDEWHLNKAQELRIYVAELKEWIHKTERRL